MFDTDKGLGPGPWLKWFMVVAIAYGICTFWPENKIITMIGAGLSGTAIAIAKRKIRSGRDDGGIDL